MLQASSWRLTSASGSLGSDPSCLRRSWALVRSSIRRGWSPTCPSSMSSFVEHLYLYQVPSVTLPNSVLLYSFQLFINWTWVLLDSVFSAQLYTVLFCFTWLYLILRWLSLPLLNSTVLHPALLNFTELNFFSLTLLNSVLLNMTWFDLTLTLHCSTVLCSIQLDLTV